MTQDHDEIEQLLAGYALGSLSGEDARRADAVLTEHVPGCPMCRDTLADFQTVTGELALAAPARTAPDLLLPGMLREIGDEPGRPLAGRFGRGRGFGVLAAAASVVAILAISGVAVTMSRATKAENQRSFLQQAFDTSSRTGAAPVSLEGEGTSPEAGMSQISPPGAQELILYGTGCPDPAPGNVYRLWLGREGDFTFLHEFTPDGGWVGLDLEIDTSTFDEILVTEEPVDAPTDEPSGVWRWGSSLS